MLAESPEAIAEEFAIHDYDDFGGIRLGEWEDVDHVCELATALVAHGLAFAAWYASALDLPMSEPHRARRGHDFWPPAEVRAEAKSESGV
jgi:antirestriction protein